MPPPSPAPAADRNLLFGILALQMDFIGRDNLVEAMHAWVLDKARPLGHILRDQGRLSAERLQLLEALVAEHLKAHDGELQQSLAAVSSQSSVEQELRSLGDGDLEASLALLGAARPVEQATTIDRRPDGPGPRFRILRPHAKGGLGEVFVAEDTELHRPVALKEIRPEHAHDPYRRGRFLLEAEITGGLEHPGVVPVYGLGQYADGRPFYAMRFVQGDNLKTAIDHFHQAERPGRAAGQRRLELRQLLGRFVDVCQAVAYAHSRGVLHRDLKPGNIMLGKYGETLLVDWGLAKTVGRPEGTQAPDEATLRPPSGSGEAATLAGSAVGTPSYMSPEQAEGRLDELGPATDVYGLGATLYALLTGQPPFPGRDQAEVLARVRRGELVPPRRVKAEVPAPLDAICRKAMALRPRERYASALALAADVEHWLADEPVTAYREPLGARLSRWARRHPARVAAAVAALLVALLAGGAAWRWAAQRRAETEQAAGLALGKAEQLRAQAGQLPREGPARAAEALAVWKQALAAAEQAEDMSAAGLVGEETTARAAGLLAELRAGVDQAEQVLARARKDARMLDDLDKAHLAYSSGSGQAFDFEAGAAAYRAAFTNYGLDVRGHEPAATIRALRRLPARMREAIAMALDDWALCAPTPKARQPLGELADAVDDDSWRRHWRHARDLETLKGLAVQARRQSLPAVSLDLLAVCLLRGGARAEAVTLLRAAQRRFPADFWINFNLANALYTSDQKSNQTLDEAIGYYRAAVALRPANARVLNNLGNALLYRRNLREAIAVYRKALAIDPKFASAHSNLGGALHLQGDVAGAISEYQRAIALDPALAMAHYNLGTIRQAQGNVAEAIVEYLKAIALGPKYAPAYTDLGLVLQAQGNLAGAITAHQRAIALGPKVARAHYNLGVALQAQRDLTGAGAAYQRALALEPKLAQAHDNLGTVLQMQGNLTGAIAAYRRAIALDPKCSLTHNNLGLALKRQGNGAGAIAAFQTAIGLDGKLAQPHLNLGLALEDTGDVAGAIAAYQKAISLDPKYADAYCALGLILRRQGRLPQSLASLRRGHALGARRAHWRYPSARWVKETERLVELDQQLPAFLKGERQPRNAAEALELAGFCQRPYKQLYAAAARFYRAAFAAEPKQVEGGRPGRRYDAACAAALAGCDRGKDAAGLDAPERARLRRQALAWLRANFSAWQDVFRKAPNQAPSAVRRTLRHWQQDNDLTGVRDQAALAKLPEAERQKWAKLWDDVAALLAKAGGKR
jgi:tetratricopeptide (TPR) repeat protein/tRNA A-37 threonylcarbamoyl transferase component Bud32